MRLHKILTTLAVSAILSACGGGGGGSDTSASATTPTVTVNLPPVAKAGANQSVVAPATVSLNGSASYDPEGGFLTYSWKVVSQPAGSSQNSMSGPTPVLGVAVPGTYTLQLTVNDGKQDNTNADSIVTVTVSAAIAAPVANAGPAQNAKVDSWVTLDGSASSDANLDALTYAWTVTSKPTGSKATLGFPNSVKSVFYADFPGTYILSLVVNDGKLSSNVSTVTVTASVLHLYLVQNSLGGGTHDVPVSFPYSYTNTTYTYTSNWLCGYGYQCPSLVRFAKSRLDAKGNAFTISNLSATNITSGSSIVPVFDGLANGQVIADGETVYFTLKTPRTFGERVVLNYKFTVAETGETFSYTTSLETN